MLLLLLFLVLLFKEEIKHIVAKWLYSDKIQLTKEQEIVKACRYMSLHKIGALIVLSSNTLDYGRRLNSEIFSEIIISIFTKSSPLHDGAMIITNDKISSVKCILPLSKKVLEGHGTRHLSAIGITEITNSIAIIVSEETGRISISKHGQLKPICINHLVKFLM